MEVESLLKLNEELKLKFDNNICFKWLRDGTINRADHLDNFLESFQVLSDQFQKAMLIKTAFCSDPRFMPSFKQHFKEEVGHDDLLRGDRNSSHHESSKYDAILDATTSWFSGKMLSTNHYEQATIMNICIESAALIIYKNAKPALDPNDELKYFGAHGEVDLDHFQIGVDAIQGLTGQHYARLQVVLRESWEMIDAVMQRIGELTVSRK